MVSWFKLGRQHSSQDKPPNVIQILGIYYKDGIPGLVTPYYQHNNLVQYIEQWVSRHPIHKHDAFRLSLVSIHVASDPAFMLTSNSKGDGYCTRARISSRE